MLDAGLAYLRMLGGSVRRGADIDEVRAANLDALGARARGELPDVSPRGGARWSPRYVLRRAAWYALDHAWEIEDRTEPP